MATASNTTPVNEPSPARRGFLRGLVTLPLIGGGVTLIGNPTAAAVPVTPELLDSYDAWLFYERRYLRFERFGRNASDWVLLDNPGAQFHQSPDPLVAPQPSTRAAAVLAAAGCPLTEEG